MKHEVYVDFQITGFEDITPDEITKLLDIQPIKVHIKGQNKGRAHPEYDIVWKANSWRMSSSLGKFTSFIDQMNALLDIIEPKMDLFKPLCGKYYTEFSCAIYIRYGNDESTPWVHLDERYHRIAKELNAEFDIDLYSLPNS